MRSDPRVVFGMPAYNRPDTLARVFESLLSQTYDDFAIVIVDDRPSAEVAAIVSAYAPLHGRVTYEPNPVRLGMIGNWRKAFRRSHEIYPRSEYFAWISDHDMWHPRWVEVLVGLLDQHPEAVLAYPLIQRVFPTRRRSMTRLVDTAGMTNRVDRMRVAVEKMTAGNCVYGLFRVSALLEAGVFRPVLAPDRQLIVELSLLGEFRHVPEILWYREVAGVFSYKRQREMFFPTRIPLYTFLPANVQHFALLVWDFCVRGRGGRRFGRIAGAGYAIAHLWYSTKRELLRDSARWRVAVKRTAIGRRLLGTRAPTQLAEQDAYGDASSEMAEAAE